MKNLLIFMLAIPLSVTAQPTSAYASELARIAAAREQLQQERQRVEQEQAQHMRDCWQRFAVNDCLRDVRRQKRVLLDPLRTQELSLNAQERMWLARERDERLGLKNAPQERDSHAAPGNR